MPKYALLENGTIHTINLSLSDANEMKERHARIFDTHTWEIVPMQSVNGLQDNSQNGFLARHRRNAIRYHRP